MIDPYVIDADMPGLLAPLKFRNSDRPHLVIAGNKAASIAKGFRETADIVKGVSGERPKDIVIWLNDLAGKFERCESVGD